MRTKTLQGLPLGWCAVIYKPWHGIGWRAAARWLTADAPDHIRADARGHGLEGELVVDPIRAFWSPTASRAELELRSKVWEVEDMPRDTWAGDWFTSGRPADILGDVPDGTRLSLRYRSYINLDEPAVTLEGELQRNTWDSGGQLASQYWINTGRDERRGPDVVVLAEWGRVWDVQILTGPRA